MWRSLWTPRYRSTMWCHVSLSRFRSSEPTSAIPKIESDDLHSWRSFISQETFLTYFHPPILYFNNFTLRPLSLLLSQVIGTIGCRDFADKVHLLWTHYGGMIWYNTPDNPCESILQVVSIWICSPCRVFASLVFYKHSRFIGTS